MNHPSFNPSAEQISALVDGQLHGADLDQALQACEDDEALLHRWRDYHLIGDVLRGVPPVVGVDEARLLSRLRPMLAHQPSARPGFSKPLSLAAAAPAPSRPEAANEPRYRWRWAAGFAVLTLVAGVSWTTLDELRRDEPALAQGESAPVLVAGPQGVVMRDAALEELMEAHRQQGGASVLPMPSGFLRNATFDASPVLMARAAPASR